MPTGYDFTLTAKNKTWHCKLAGDFRINTISDGGQLAININSENKRIGDFATQTNWKGGRGVENFSHNPNGYFDSQNAWTLNENRLMSGLQWRFGRGTRTAANAVEDFDLPGSVKWQPIYAGAANTGIYRYYSRSWTAGATGNADKAMIWIRRKGSPGTLTIEQCPNSSGSPGTANKTVTKTIADVTDTVSVLLENDWTTTTALVSGTLYHLKVYGASTDGPDDHWEIAVDSSGTSSKYSSDNSAWTTAAFSFYYMVTDADYVRRLWYFRYRGLMYAVAQYFDGTASKLFINGARGKASSGTGTTLTDSHTLDVPWTTNKWANAYFKIIGGTGVGSPVVQIASNTTTVLTFSTALGVAPDSTSEYIIYFTDRWAALTAGLTQLSSKPIVFNDIVYFPQGATAIRKMRFNAAAGTPTHEFADDTANTASFLDEAINASFVPVIVKLYAGAVSAAPAVAWASPLVFANSVSIAGDPEYFYTGLKVHKNATHAFAENRAIAIGPDNKPVKLNWGWEDSPSPYNGAAAASNGDYLYVSWLFDVYRIYGGQVQNVGLSWRGSGLPANRQGFFRSFFFSNQWLYAAMNAGTGISSVLVYDGLNWHEIVQAWKANCLIRDCQIQNTETPFSRVWIDMGGYPAYIDMPSYTNNPYYASNVNYQHETVVISPTIDNGAASRLKKTMEYLTALTENLQNGQRIIYVDYQYDNDVGSNNWTPSSDAFQFSPEDTARVPVKNFTRFRYRLRMNTNAVTTPIVVKEIGPNGMSRTPYKLSWNLTIDAGDIVGSNKKTGADEMVRWLMECAQNAIPIRIESDKWASLNNFAVQISAPIVMPKTPKKGRQDERSKLSLTFIQDS